MYIHNYLFFGLILANLLSLSTFLGSRLDEMPSKRWRKERIENKTKKGRMT